MKTVKIVSFALVSTLVFFSCKDAKTPSSEIEIVSEKEIALTETTLKEPPSVSYLYVTASTGLSLREHPNLQSEKLAVMPYGTRVKIIEPEKNSTMKVGNLKGGMDKIEFNQKKGFAFNGFLSNYFPPEKGISAKRYAEELKKDFPKVIYVETTGGTASMPSNSETIIIPNSEWHEVFYIAQQLFNFPKEFVFPSPKGKEFETIKEKKIQKGASMSFNKNIWTSELQITRKKDTLTKIEYVYKNKGYSKVVSIDKTVNSIKISSTELVE